MHGARALMVWLISPPGLARGRREGGRLARNQGPPSHLQLLAMSESKQKAILTRASRRQPETSRLGIKIRNPTLLLKLPQ